MKKERIEIKTKNKTLTLFPYKVPKWFEGIGLMFSRRKKAKMLLFSQKKPSRMAIHSLFVFFPFLAVWTDEKNKIIEIRKIHPFKGPVSPSIKYKNLIEIPFNEKYDDIIQSLVGKEKI